MEKRKAVASVKLDGWKRTTGKGRRTGREDWSIETQWANKPIVGPWVMLENEDEKVVLIFNFSNYDQTISGHTYFENDGGWYTFDRTGIDDSFHATYANEPKSYENALDVEAIVDDALKRVAKSRARGGQVSVPGLPGVSILKSKVDSLISKLKGGESITITPAGMGTGYRLATRKPRGGWWQAASKEAASFFKVQRLYFETIDCD